MSARLHEHYQTNIRPALIEGVRVREPHEVPRLDKIVINMGVGEAVSDRKKVDGAVADLTAITGQQPVITKSQACRSPPSSCAKAWPIGAKVTLRREHMYEFLDRLITIALPRVRDFRGSPASSFDGSGNYAWGSKSRSCFLRSSTTRSTRCAAWTSSSARRRRPTRKPRRFSGLSTCRS